MRATCFRPRCPICRRFSSLKDMRQLAYEFSGLAGNYAPPPVTPAATALIGRAVLRMRLYRGWRQSDLELRSGVDQTTISRLERGRRRGLSILRLAAILDALGVAGVEFKPAAPTGPAADLEEQLMEDRWLRAGRFADERLRRTSRTRTTISTRPSSETPM
jgi:transcriptional regulator with XRE-family HTH domain